METHELGALDATAEEIEMVPGASEDRSGRRVARKVVVGLVSLTLVAGVLAAVLLRSGPKSPEEELNAIVAFVGEARTVHVDGESTWSSVSGGGGLGNTTTTRSRLAADLALGGQSSRVRWEDGTYIAESILVDGVVYSRMGEDDEELAAEQWVADDHRPTAEETTEVLQTMIDDGDVEGLVSEGLSISSTLGEAGFGYEGLDALLAGFDGAARVSPGVIRVETSITSFLQGAAPDVDFGDVLDDVEGTVTVDLWSGPDGRLDRMVTKVDAEADGETSTSAEDLRFSRWGEDIEVAAPPGGEIDATPSFDEESLTTASFPALAPRSVAAPMRLVGAGFDEGDEDDEACPTTFLRYADPEDERRSLDWKPGDDDVLVRSLDISMTPVACTAEDDWRESMAEDGDPVPFAAGPNHGTIDRYDDPDYGPSMTIVLLVGDVRLDVNADVPEADVVAALADLAPLDLASQPVAEVNVAGR
jgi:hypothetical protein